MNELSNEQLRDMINDWSRDETARDAQIPDYIAQALNILFTRSLEPDFKYRY